MVREGNLVSNTKKHLIKDVFVGGNKKSIFYHLSFSGIQFSYFNSFFKKLKIDFFKLNNISYQMKDTFC